MPDPFDARAYLSYLSSRWRFPAILMAAALAAATLFSLLQPNRYTAKVSLIIEPPASSDPRAAMAVSPIYLESLRTYEHFASSDHLFAQAAEKFGLRDYGPLESVKRSILDVSIPRNTKILEIAVTLPEPRKAHALATYLARQSMELNRQTGRATDDDLAVDAGREAQKALERFHASEQALAKAMSRPPTRESLEADLAQLRERRAELQRLALSAALSLADQEDRERALVTTEASGSDDVRSLRARLRSSRTYAAKLREESTALAAEAARKEKLLAARRAETELLGAEYEAAQAARERSEKRLADIAGMSGYRSERLSLLDPGFVPERPSSPNVPLILCLAAALAIIVSLVYLTAEYSFRPAQVSARLKLPRVLGKP
jgi:capsular polysaccharide biosynthesis protein